ncbi:MAG: outer membrane protein assembly factor BamA [Bacteroidota bacterium]|nr:outer membrane protein assembly factor BamA [Bacteroidota bacterium]
MHKKLALFLLLLIFSYSGFSQEVADSTNVSVSYSSPQKYIIGGMEVVGIKYFDHASLLQATGLQIGDEIDIPGESITSAIKNLWNLQLFSDVKVVVAKVVKGKAFLEFHLQEVPSLSKVNVTGVTKSEKEAIFGKLLMIEGQKISKPQLNNAQKSILDYFKEKGFFNTEVTVVQRDDPAKKNFVFIDITVDKKQKVKIKKINFHGVENVPVVKLEKSMKKTKEKKLRNFFFSKKFLEDKYREDKDNVIAKYNELGYRDAVITSDSIRKQPDNTVSLDIWVNEGQRYYFGDIRWVGNTVYDNLLLEKVLGIKKGDIYDLKLLNKRLKEDPDAVSSLYQDNGYVFFQIDPVEVKIEKDTINFEMRMFEGQQATINRVIIHGNTKTHENVARRELRTLPGELFSKDNLMRSYRELGQLGHFDPEKIKPDVIPNYESGTVDVKYDVEEKANDQVELSGGWGGGMLIGSVGLKFSNFSIRNIFNKEAWRPLPTGDGQTLSLRVQTNGKVYQTYSLSFVEPWFGGKKPNSLSFSLYHNIYTVGDNSYYSNPYSNYYNGYGSGYGGYGGYSGYGGYGGYGGYTADYSDYTVKSKNVTSGISLGYGYRLSWPDDFFNIYHELSYQHNYLKNWNYGYSIISNGNTNTVSLKTVLGRSSVVNPIYTREGSSFSLSIELTPPYSLWDGKNYSTQAELNALTPQYASSSNTKTAISDQERFRWVEFHKWKLKGSNFTPLTNDKKLILNTKFEYGYIGYYNKNKRSPIEGFTLGGDGMTGMSYYTYEVIGLRGYENNSLTASPTANLYNKLTMELRYPIALKESATIYALAFLEGGNSWYDIKQYNPFDIKRSAGVGVRIFLPMFGLMGIDWGYGFDKTHLSGGTGNKGQFHFVIGQQF